MTLFLNQKDREKLSDKGGEARRKEEQKKAKERGKIAELALKKTHSGLG